MRVVTMAMLNGDESVAEALTMIHEPGQALLARLGGEVRLFKASQLRRGATRSARDRQLRDLPWRSSAPVFVLDQSQLDQFGIQSAGNDLSGNLQALMKSLGQRFALFASPTGFNYLISSSEDHLVDYYCEKNGHEYSPPPAWFPGMKCHCNSPIIREG